MTRALLTGLVLALVVLQPRPAASHHSNVAYEVTKVITITGVVKSFEWVNPHTWLTVVVDDGKGGTVEWACEGRAPGILRRAGWSRTILKAGEKVTVDMSPSKDGSKVSIIARVTKADGTILSNQPQFDPRGN
jgi:DNA/RNA endonuclease YhcR with UshA esterase domain